MACLTRDRGYVSEAQFISASCSDPMSLGTASCVSSAPRLLANFGLRACSVRKALRLDGVYERGMEVGPEYYFDNGVVECEMRTFSDTTSAWATGADALDSLPRLTLEME